MFKILVNNILVMILSCCFYTLNMSVRAFGGGLIPFNYVERTICRTLTRFETRGPDGPEALT